MPHLHIFSSAERPPIHFECQIRTFMRTVWPDETEDEDDYDEPLTDPALHPVHFVLARSRTVVSHARLIWLRIPCLESVCKVYGLGDVFTFPASRNRGYGSQVVAAATDHIRNDPEADLAVLLTESALETFYRQSGWETFPGFSLLTGDGADPQPVQGFPMMLFVSEKARACRDQGRTHSLFLPGDEW